MPDSQLRLLFVLEGDFRGPTEQQAFGFAQELVARGHRVMLSVWGDPSTLEHQGLSLEPGIELRRHTFRGPWLDRDAIAAARRFAPSLIHAWNPRPKNMSAARAYRRATGAPYVVHFEDDEFSEWPVIAESFVDKAVVRVKKHLWRLYPPWLSGATNLTRSWVQKEAAGLEAIVPALAREVEARLGRDCSLQLPVLPQRSDAPAGASRIKRDGKPVVLFAGRVMANSLADFTLGMHAVALLRNRGVQARLAQAGQVGGEIDLVEHARRVGLPESALELLGHLSQGELLATVRDADVLIQPGPSSRQNTLRLPAKIDLYLRSGVPTITFAGGLTELLKDGQEVLMTHTDEPQELADRLHEVLTNPELRDRLASQGQEAARRLFDPARNTDTLLELYRRSLEHASAS